MGTREDSMRIEAPASRELGAQAMKARVSETLFGHAAALISIGRYEIVETLGAGGMGVVYAAWDESLGRKVAIKVLPAERVGADRERARLVREAQALAKLSHPNVVQVYEVGEHEGGVFVAMELIEGTSLQQWQAKTHRSVQEIAEVYTQAGVGLGAAHRAGLVHRDFKPANVLVGNDGRVRVVDFGLALGPGLYADSSGAGGRSLEVSPTGSVTRTGTLVGTPAYMAPEQLAGEESDARADQFSFCVALYEAIAGCRPFDPKALRLARAGPPPVMAHGSRSPPWALGRALRRGLEIDPTQRWPDMDALLRAMDAGARWRRRAWTWAGPIALGLGALAFAFAGRGEISRCEVPSEGPSLEWSERRDGVHEALLATGKPFAADTWRATELQLGEFAERFGEVFVQACKESRTEYSAQMSECLDERAIEFSIALDELEKIDEQSVENVIVLLDSLEGPESCASPPSGIVAVKPAASVEIEESLSRARAWTALGHYMQADVELLSLRDNPELEGTRAFAQVLELHGRVQARRQEHDKARESLFRASEEAGRGEFVRVQALLASLELALDLERWDSAGDLSVQVGVAVAVRGDPPQLKARHLDAQGRLNLEADGNAEAAVDFHRRALVEWERLEKRGRRATTTRIRLANALADLGDAEGAKQSYREALSAREREVGRDHPEYAVVLFNLGLLAYESGDYATARDMFTEALPIERARLGPDSSIAARTEVKLAQALMERRQFDEALRRATSAWKIQSALPTGNSDRIAALRSLANIELELELYPQSLEHHRQMVHELGPEGDPDPIQGIAVSQNIAWLLCQTGQCGEARPWIRDVRAQLVSASEIVERLEEDEGRSQAKLALELLTLFADHVDGLILLAEGDRDAALALFERLRADAKALHVPDDNEFGREHIAKLIAEASTEIERIRQEP